MMIDPSQLNWPEQPPSEKFSDEEIKKVFYSAELGVVTSQVTALTDRDKAARASYETLNQAVFSAYLEVAKGQIDRATARAEFIEKAAGTIATLYTGILAFTYNVDTNKGKAFPAVGIAPTFFLGLSIVLAMFYLGYITQPKRFKESASSGLLSQHLIDERNDFISWTSNVVIRRAPWLQTAIISLGFGVIFLPASYLTVSVPETYLWYVIGASAVFLLLHLLWRLKDSQQQQTSTDGSVGTPVPVTK